MQPEDKQILEKQRVHRLSPVLQAWRAILAVLVLGIVQSYENLDREVFIVLGDVVRAHLLMVLLPIVLVPVLVVAVLWVVSIPWWRATWYHIGQEEISLQQGVLKKTRTTARIEKIQAVDVAEPFLPRLFGLAELHVETAGGQGSSLIIRYLPKQHADALRAQLTGETAHHTAHHSVARALVATALQSWWAVVIVLAFALIPGANVLLVPMLVGAVPAFWAVLNRSWRFTIDIDDSVRMTYGLATRRKQTIPLDRIHAIELSQPFVWRGFDWWMVRVTAIGYDAKKSGSSVVLPVGTYAEAQEILRRLGVQLAAQPSNPTYVSPRQARWVSPVDHRQQAVTVDQDTGHVTIHYGRLYRRAAIVAGRHIQELSAVQGPLQRALGLEHIRLDLVPGSVQMIAKDLQVADAQRLLTQLRQREVRLLRQ